jgi:hypothetical protein
MRAVALLEGLNSDTCKRIIVRNLSRIMDIRILDIDIQSRTLSFLYENSTAFEKTKRELYSIGYPILKCTYQKPVKKIDRIDYLESTI